MLKSKIVNVYFTRKIKNVKANILKIIYFKYKILLKTCPLALLSLNLFPRNSTVCKHSIVSLQLTPRETVTVTTDITVKHCYQHNNSTFYLLDTTAMDTDFQMTRFYAVFLFSQKRLKHYYY